MQNRHIPRTTRIITDQALLTRAFSHLGVVVFFSLGLISVIYIKDGLLFDAFLIALGMVSTFIGLLILKKNHIETAGLFIASTICAMVTASATTGQGIYDIATMTYPAILIIASLILQRKSVIYLTLFTIICNGWLVFGATTNLYHPAYPLDTYARQFVTTSLILVVTMSAVLVLTNVILKSLDSAKKELQERQRVEDELREAETMYRALVEQTSVVTYRDQPNANASIIYISPQIETLIGYTQAEWTSDNFFWQNLVHPDDLPRVLNEIHDYIETKTKSISEYRLLHKSGNWIWVRDESIVVCDDSNSPKYIHGVYIDITEKKAAELAVKQREAILAAAAETAQLLLKTMDWQTQIDAILGSLGQAANASHVYILENHQDSDQTSPLQNNEWTAPGIDASLKSPRIQNNLLSSTKLEKEEWFGSLNSGKYFYGNEKQYPQLWDTNFNKIGLKALLEVPIFVHGDWWGVIGFDNFVYEMPWSQTEIDVLVATAGNIGAAIERQITDAALRISEEKFQLAFHHTYIAMAISRTKDHTLVDVNDAFCKVTGFSREDALGRRAGGDLHIWNNQADRNTVVEQLYKQGFVDEYKAEFRRKNGEIGTALLSAVSVNIAGEACQLFSFYDISRMDHLMKELAAKNDELQSFTYTVSHDLRAPLITMSGFLGYLEQDAKSGNVERVLQDSKRIKDAVIKMEHLLSELLELSRIGRIMNPPEEVGFGKIVHDALQLVEGRLKQKQIKVKVEANFPMVHGDRVRLTEVVQNLVDNAAKFSSQQNNPQIEIGYENQPDKNIFFIRDNGIGIKPEFHEKIFGLFNKLDAQSDGTGIGLALVKKIVEVHGGKIWVESKGDGTGSTFFFTLENHNNKGAQ